MTTSPRDSGLANSNPAKINGLTAIHGIGPDRATRFRESSIDTLQKLAAISDEKATSVAATIRCVSAQMIQDWRAEAQDHLSQLQVKGEAKARSETEAEQEEAKAPTGTEAEQEEARAPTGTEAEQREAKAQTEIEAEPREWRSIASFSVAFQSRPIRGQGEERRAQIVHRQGDGPQFFYDIDGDKPWRWILDQLGERSQPQAAPQERAVVQARTTESSTAAEPSIQAEIGGVRAFQPPKTEAPIEASTSGKLLQGFLERDEPFAVKATVRLTGPDSGNVATERQACRAQLFARPLPPGMPIDLGDMQCDALGPGKPAYTVHLPEANLPSGVYRLQVMITIQGAEITSRCLDGPVLQVV